MNSQRWQKIEEAVAIASEISISRRKLWLDEFCGGDRELKTEIESLLIFESEAENFLEKQITPYAAKIFPENNNEFINKQLGHYRIVREIGRGGMGAVFLAERADGEFNQQVALKIVRQTILDSESENRFRRERQILASLNHANIAKLLDGGVSKNGEPFLAMEFIEGETLLEFAAEKKLSIEERLKLFLKICAGVAFAHRNLVVHRDIKPSNILIAKDGEAKLLDFGLAKILDFEIDSAQTATAFQAMTPAYASPEQMRGENVTTASDIYSLGVVLYELLTGNRPYKLNAGGIEEIIRQISTDEPTKPSLAKNTNSQSVVRNSQLKGDLDNIVLMSLRKEPERRYQSVEAFVEDIERYLHGLPVAARPNTFSYRAEKFIKRNKVGVFAAVFVFLAIVSGLIVSLWQAEIARRQRDLARQEQIKAERINNFLQEMLSFSNQSVTSISPVPQKKDVAVNEMLDEIAPQINIELADEPEVRAQIMRTIGSSYASQGRYDSAEKYLHEALEIQMRLYGEDNAETAATMFESGALAYRQIKLVDANQLLEKSVAFYRRQQQSDFTNFNPAKLAQALDSLGTVKVYLGDVQSSVALLNEALQIATTANLQGSERLILASIETNLGGVLIRTGENDKGETLLRQSLALYNQISTNPRWEKGATLVMLGELSNNRNQPNEAENFLIESESIYRQTLGDKNAYLSYNLEQQTIALNQENDFRGAESKAREALAIAESVFPAESPLLTQSLAALGFTLNKIGRARESEDYLRRALTINESQPTKNFADIVADKIGLSESLLAQNRLEEAANIALEAVNDSEQNLGEQNVLSKEAKKNLEKIREKSGKNKSAKKY